MALYEEGDNKVCRVVLGLSESQGQTSETPRLDEVVTHYHVEMGRDYYGFYHKVA